MESGTKARMDLFFDPDQHPDATLKAFQEFTKRFNLRYDALHPDPPKTSLETAIARWKIETNTNAAPTLQQYDEICDAWKARDKVRKLLGMYSSERLYADWCIAVPDEEARSTASWNVFTTTMNQFYQPTENITLKHYQFRTLKQKSDETFIAFCNRVQKEASHCRFKCTSNDCTSEEVAIRDQIVIGINDTTIRQEALKKSWSLTQLRQHGMTMESAIKGGVEIIRQRDGIFLRRCSPQISR